MELLAPCGSESAVIAAVQSGADAIYIGGSDFSARKNAVNFTIPQIEETVKYCHLRGVKVHVAANILIKDKETDRFLEYIGKLNEIGIDALIIQDLGMAETVRNAFPDLCLHASTQMSVASIEGVREIEKLGFSRVVLARELTADAIKYIAKNSDIETEVFVHGAICMCYSGQCLMSSIIGGRSGNRGLCAQPCRLEYKLGDRKGYLLSPKDMCLVNDLKLLEDAGVTSLKIEGRLKRPEYVAEVVGIYRKYLDSGKAVTAEDYNTLKNAFNRSGLTNGYLTGNVGRTMMSWDNPSNVSENVFSKAVKDRIKPDTNIRKSGIYLNAQIKTGENIKVSVWDDEGRYAEYCGDKVQQAQNTPLSESRVTEQLKKLGQTPFYAIGVTAEVSQNATASVSQINEARRGAVAAYENVLTAKKPFRVNPTVKRFAEKEQGNNELICYVSNIGQAKECDKNGIGMIIADTPLASELQKLNISCEIVSALPPVFRDDRDYAEPQTEKVWVSSLAEIHKYKNKKMLGGFRLNVFNMQTAAYFDKTEAVCVSPELNIKEMADVAKGNIVFAYGRLPLMVMENCPLAANKMCRKKQMSYNLSDRKKESFPFKCCEGCVVELLNSKPLYMADKADDLIKLGAKYLLLYFTDETEAKTGQIIRAYQNALCKKEYKKMPENSFTRGHFYRGVE